MLSRENCIVPMDGFLTINIENKSALLTVLGNGLKCCTRGSCRFQLLRSTFFFVSFTVQCKMDTTRFFVEWCGSESIGYPWMREEKSKVRYPSCHVDSILTPVFTFMIGILESATRSHLLLARTTNSHTFTIIQVGLHYHMTIWWCYYLCDWTRLYSFASTFFVITISNSYEHLYCC
jgi:hypothetical protein